MLKPRISDRILIIAMILSASILQGVYGRQSERTFDTPIGVRVLYYSVLIGGFAGLFVVRKAIGPVLKQSLPLIALLAIAFASYFWSDNPSSTFTRAIALTSTCLVAFYFAVRLRLQGFIDSIGLGITIMAAIDLVLALAFPDIGLQPDGSGAWAGLQGDKNPCGWSMALGAFTLAFSIPDSRGSLKTFRIAGFVLCLIVLAGSRSGTALAVVASLAAIFPGLLKARAMRSVNALVIAVVVSLVVAALIATNLDDVLALFGKDSTFSGRTDLWNAELNAIAQRPLGYGYGIFWDPNGPADALINPLLTWVPGEAHNGYFGVALDFGWLGEIALLALLAQALIAALKLFWQPGRSLYAWPLAVTLSSIVSNLAEANFARVEDLYWIVLLSAFYFSLGIGLDNIAPEEKPQKARLKFALPSRRFAYKSTSR